MTNLGDAASGAGDREDAVRLLNDLQDISFLKIALILFGTWAAIRLVRTFFPYLAERGPSTTRLYLLGAVPILRLGLIVIAVLWIVPIVFDITFGNFLVIAGAASLAVGFAFKDLVSAVIAGVVALIERPYRAGDWVKVGEDYGEIRRMGLRAMTLVTADDNAISVPHSLLWTDNISNANDGAGTLQCVGEFYLAPSHDGRAIRRALIDVALTSPYLGWDMPVVAVLSETPYATHYKLRAYPFDMRDQFLFVSDLTARGKLAVEAAGGRIVTATAAIDPSA